RIVVAADAGNDVLTFSVTDTGRGIPEKLQEEVFKKFSRLHHSTDSRERGAGLGLAISKGLVEAHGGRIWFESEEGKGSSFHFEIPRA
ncbi:MAG: sensor histidine kinase, partial [Candidatus Geothermincolia bacterium]